MAFGGNLSNVGDAKAAEVYENLVGCMKQEFENEGFIQNLKERIDLDSWDVGSHVAIGDDDDDDDDYIQAIRATYQERDDDNDV